MPQQVVQTDKAPKPAGPYSQCLRAGDLLFVAGQIPLDPSTGKLAGSAIEEQTRRVVENIQAILEAGGATMGQVVKTGVDLSDLALFARFNEVYAGYFLDPKPARITVGS